MYHPVVSFFTVSINIHVVKQRFVSLALFSVIFSQMAPFYVHEYPDEYTFHHHHPSAPAPARRQCASKRPTMLRRQRRRRHSANDVPQYLDDRTLPSAETVLCDPYYPSDRYVNEEEEVANEKLRAYMQNVSLISISHSTTPFTASIDYIEINLQIIIVHLRISTIQTSMIHMMSVTHKSSRHHRQSMVSLTTMRMLFTMKFKDKMKSLIVRLSRNDLQPKMR